MNAENLDVELAGVRKWYTFHQNNSFGTFDINEDVDGYVIIEARDHNEANELAGRIGIYFDGCADGRDCSCCGDRWSRQYSDDKGEVVPKIYDEEVAYSPDGVTRGERGGGGRGNNYIVYPYSVISQR